MRSRFFCLLLFLLKLWLKGRFWNRRNNIIGQSFFFCLNYGLKGDGYISDISPVHLDFFTGLSDRRKATGNTGV